MDGPLLSAPRLQRVRVKGNKMRGKRGGTGANGGGECGRRRTTPGEETRSAREWLEHTHNRPELEGRGFRQSRTSSSSLDSYHY